MSANKIKKKIAELTLEYKEKSAEVQKMLHIESKRVAKLDEELAITIRDIEKEEKKMLELAERNQGKTSAVREAEMFREKRCSQLEVRLARTRQMMSNTEDENQQIRAKIDEQRRLVMMQTEVYATNQSRMLKIQQEQQEMLLHSDNVLFEKDIITRKIEEIVEKNAMEVEDTERLMAELMTYIDHEAKQSKEFYERQMKEKPVFDDSFKENLVAEIRKRALAYADEQKSEADIENELNEIKDAFARLRDEAIGDQSFDDAVRQYIAVESDCIKIMSYIRAKEVEVEVEEEMATKFRRDTAAKLEANELLRKKHEEVDVFRRERDAVLDEEDRLKRELGKLKQQTARWAQALNSMFKALSVDLETMGIYGGRVTGDSDLLRLMGVVEAKAQKTLGSFSKFVAAGGMRRTAGATPGKAPPLGALGGTGSEPTSPVTVPEKGGGSPAAPASGRSPGTPKSPTGFTGPNAASGNAGAPPPPQSPGLSLPRIPAASFGSRPPESHESDFGAFVDDGGDDDDDDELVKPMSSIELKRSLQSSISITSVKPKAS
jgi:hypothetical protein